MALARGVLAQRRNRLPEGVKFLQLAEDLWRRADEAAAKLDKKAESSSSSSKKKSKKKEKDSGDDDGDDEEERPRSSLGPTPSTTPEKGGKDAKDRSECARLLSEWTKEVDSRKQEQEKEKKEHGDSSSSSSSSSSSFPSPSSSSPSSSSSSSTQPSPASPSSPRSASAAMAASLAGLGVDPVTGEAFDIRNKYGPGRRTRRPADEPPPPLPPSAGGSLWSDGDGDGGGDGDASSSSKSKPPPELKQRQRPGSRLGRLLHGDYGLLLTTSLALVIALVVGAALQPMLEQHRRAAALNKDGREL